MLQRLRLEFQDKRGISANRPLSYLPSILLIALYLYILDIKWHSYPIVLCLGRDGLHYHGHDIITESLDLEALRHGLRGNDRKKYCE